MDLENGSFDNSPSRWTPGLLSLETDEDFEREDIVRLDLTFLSFCSLRSGTPWPRSPEEVRIWESTIVEIWRVQTFCRCRHREVNEIALSQDH